MKKKKKKKKEKKKRKKKKKNSTKTLGQRQSDAQRLHTRHSWQCYLQMQGLLAMHIDYDLLGSNALVGSKGYCERNTLVCKTTSYQFGIVVRRGKIFVFFYLVHHIYVLLPILRF